MARTRSTARPLSPRAALVLVGLFVALGLVVLGLNALRSSPSAQTSVTTSTSQPAAATSGAATPSSTGPAARITARTSASAGRSAAAGAPTVAPTVAAAQPPGRDASLRTKALFVLAVVDSTGSAPEGYVGGRQFMNDSRGGTTALPYRDPAGRRIVYHEYDVNPKVSGVDRGPQRLVVGDDGSAWTTGDHYVTWKRLR